MNNIINMNNDIMAISIAQNYLECSNYLYDDDDMIDIIITSENGKNKNRICNIENICRYRWVSLLQIKLKPHTNLKNMFIYYIKE